MTLEEFLEEHIDLVDDENFDVLYEQFYSAYRGELTQFFFDNDIDPQQYLTTIPANYLPPSYTGSFVIQSNIESIDSFAFSHCTNLTDVTILHGLTSIGYGAFYNCDSLTRTTIPDSVVSIGGGVFYGCKSLTDVTIGNGVKSIGISLFGDCTQLQSINYSGTKEEWDKIKKDRDWHDDSRINTIHCIDGNIEYSTFKWSV